MKQIETYQLSDDIDNDMIFIVNRDELDTRFDPQMALYRHKSLSSLYPKVKLVDLLVCKPQYGAAESGIERISEEEPRYIRITDIDDNGLISHDELGVTTETIEDKFILNDDDVLIARSGATVGKSYIHKKTPYRCLYAGYLIRFIVDKSKILPDYLFSFTQLKTYKEWIAAIQRPGAQPNINAEEFQSLEIPLPNIVTQKIIVETMNAAYKLKHQKEQETATILKDIDNYILGELSIKLPATLDDYLEDGHFIAYFSDVIGNRLDPNGIYIMMQKPESTKYENIQLYQIAAIEKGEAITKECVNESGPYPVIAGGQTSPYNNDTFNYKGDVITVSASGAAGYVWYHEYPIFASDCSVIYSKDKCFLTRYIFEVLKAEQEYIYGLQQGVAQPHVYPSDLANLLIPKVELSKQKEIVEHIRLMRDEAKRLQDEGTEILKKTKEDIEKMILG